MESRCQCTLVSQKRKIKPWRGRVTSQCHTAAEWCLSRAERVTRMWARVPSACGCGYGAPFSVSISITPSPPVPPPLSILLSPSTLQTHLLPGPFPRGLCASGAQGTRFLSTRACLCGPAGLPYMSVCLSVTLAVCEEYVDISGGENLCVLGSGSLRD